MERKLELIAVARYQLESLFLLRNASDFSEIMKLVLVVAWGTFGCDYTDKSSINACTRQLALLVVRKDLDFDVITRIIEYSVNRLSDPAFGTFQTHKRIQSPIIVRRICKV